MRSVRPLLLAPLLLLPREAVALDFRAGIGLGPVQVARTSFVAISPHVGVSFAGPRGWTANVDNTFMILPTSQSVGFDNRLSAGAGYTWKRADVSAGGVIGIYRFVACGPKLCGPILGISPGGQLRASFYAVDWFGVQAIFQVHWFGGNSLVLPNETAWALTAGPIVRFHVGK